MKLFRVFIEVERVCFFDPTPDLKLREQVMVGGGDKPSLYVYHQEVC
jgi:hypothetical protein